MSVTRIGEVQAKAELTDDLRAFLLSIIPTIESSEGCEGCQLFQSQDDPTRFMMIERWDNVESHKASAQNIPPELLGQIRPLLGSAPSGSYFDTVEKP